MGNFDPVDEWFAPGFAVQRQKPGAAARSAKRDSIRARSGSAPPRGGVKFSTGAKTANVRAVIKRAPEVMVKITGSNDGLRSLKHHLDYISRNGELTLQDDDGNEISGRDSLRDLREAYKAGQYPSESTRREFLHVVFSMPAGTPERAVKDAVANFAAEEFSNRHYVLVAHNDKEHTHVHLAVATRDKYRADEPRLSPRKQDLFRWRQGFAEKLRDEGLDAAASYRKARFTTQKSERGPVRQIRKDNPNSAVFDESRATAKQSERIARAALAPDKAFSGPYRPPRTPKTQEQQAAELRTAIAEGVRPSNPHAAKIEQGRQEALRAWKEVQENLISSGDRALATEVTSLLDRGKMPGKSRLQELFDLAKGRTSQAESSRD